jgi:uncharacterized protein YdeI (YjbR/CyaY-like superfamily)
MANPDIDLYIRRSTQWPEEMAALRPVLLERGLGESIKWGKPCYSHDGKNIAIMQEMKGFLALMFFKGALLADPDGVLEEQGPNSRSAKRVTFAGVDDVERLAPTVARLVDEAIDVEASGRQVEAAVDDELVPELQRRLDADADLRRAFDALTPGRRREYNLHLADAKQPSTRESRLDKHVERIKAGKGLRDR